MPSSRFLEHVPAAEPALKRPTIYPCTRARHEVYRNRAATGYTQRFFFTGSSIFLPFHPLMPLLCPSVPAASTLLSASTRAFRRFSSASVALSRNRRARRSSENARVNWPVQTFEIRCVPRRGVNPSKPINYSCRVSSLSGN